jgi:hypothetical protein
MLLGVAAAGAARLGLNWSAEQMAVVVLPFLAVIFSISYEDGQAKAAGAGTTTTTATTSPAGNAQQVTTVTPDPTGKP